MAINSSKAKNAFSNPLNDTKIDEFIEEALFKSDGNAGERISTLLLNLLKNKTNSK